MNQVAYIIKIKIKGGCGNFLPLYSCLLVFVNSEIKGELKWIVMNRDTDKHGF